MPFSKSDSLIKRDLDYVYEHILKKAAEGYKVRGKKYFQTVERFSGKIGSIISGIVNNLNSADLVIADLTGLNPNVMYELGVRHSLKRGTIIISQDLNNLPSDLRDYLTVEYKYSKETVEQQSNYEHFKVELYKTIDELVNTNRYDSPVLSYLQQKQRFKNEEEIESLKAKAVIINAIHSTCFEIGNMISALEGINYLEVDNLLTSQLFNLKLNNLTTLLSELNISFDSGILYENLINSKTILAEINKIFAINEYFSRLQTIPELPREFYPLDVRASIEKQFVDLFELSKGNGLHYTTMKGLFKKDGVLAKELLQHLAKYVTTRIRELNMDEKEIEAIIKS